MSDTFEVGEKVIIGNTSWSKIAKVVKVTPTGQVVVDEYDMRFKDGRQMGVDVFTRSSISKWTELGERIIRDRDRRSKLLSRIKDTNFRKMPLSQLEHVVEAIDEKQEYK